MKLACGSRLRRAVPAVFALGAALAASGCGGLAAVDGGRFPAPEPDTVTFWGHGCVYIDVGGTGVVTDPVFRRTIPFRRRRGPAPPPQSYAAARVVLVSHAHPDHLDRRTLRTFPAAAVILCPQPAARHLRGLQQEVRVMRPGDVHAFAGGTVTAVAAWHPGGRWSLGSAGDGRALGYVIETGAGPEATRVFYSGDTGYHTGFARVGSAFAPDVSLLNVNDHLRPDDAARAAWATRAPVVVPLHWGTYPYWVLGGSRRPRGEDRLRRLLGERLRVLEVGGSLPLGDAGVRRRAPP